MTILLVVPRPIRSNPCVMWPLLGYNDHDTPSIVQISWVRPRKLVQQAVKKCNGQINATIMHFEDTGRQRLCTRKCLSRWAVPVLSAPLIAPFQRFEYRDCMPTDVFLHRDPFVSIKFFSVQRFQDITEDRRPRKKMEIVINFRAAKRNRGLLRHKVEMELFSFARRWIADITRYHTNGCLFVLVVATFAW